MTKQRVSRRGAAPQHNLDARRPARRNAKQDQQCPNKLARGHLLEFPARESSKLNVVGVPPEPDTAARRRLTPHATQGGAPDARRRCRFDNRDIVRREHRRHRVIANANRERRGPRREPVAAHIFAHDAAPGCTHDKRSGGQRLPFEARRRLERDARLLLERRTAGVSREQWPCNRRFPERSGRNLVRLQDWNQLAARRAGQLGRLPDFGCVTGREQVEKRLDRGREMRTSIEEFRQPGEQVTVPRARLGNDQRAARGDPREQPLQILAGDLAHPDEYIAGRDDAAFKALISVARKPQPGGKLAGSAAPEEALAELANPAAKGLLWRHGIYTGIHRARLHDRKSRRGHARTNSAVDGRQGHTNDAGAAFELS